MARSHAKLLAAIWTDPEWRALEAEGQWLYMTLLSQPRLNLVGALDLKPRQWAKLAAGMTEDRILELLDVLEAARFVLVDHDTEELVIRTFTRHDISRARVNVNILKGLWRAFDALASDELRRSVVDNVPSWLWEDERAQPSPAALELLRQAIGPDVSAGHAGSDGPSERTVQSDRSEGPSERSARTSLLPTPSLSSSPVTPTGPPVGTDRSNGPSRRTARPPARAHPADATVAAGLALADRNRRRETGDVCEVCEDSGITLDGLGHASPCPACQNGPMT